ncbi:hypothetical protein HHL17_26310 [Chitinophaga sp. G-6-1-13]|uniref:Uncharacterized protein n=1 Tax=Chitinophaga fulva TaxID=2728842 RepID=A0A848GYM6_9BACT|nr:hypothetical protein [Chitinophaga fulva]NML40738.1 hypothetical protein [Chitinophaga fulva]
MATKVAQAVIYDTMWTLKSMPEAADPEGGPMPNFVISPSNELTGTVMNIPLRGFVDLMGENNIRFNVVFPRIYLGDFYMRFVQVLYIADRYALDGNSMTLYAADRELASLTGSPVQ